MSALNASNFPDSPPANPVHAADAPIDPVVGSADSTDSTSSLQASPDPVPAGPQRRARRLPTRPLFAWLVVQVGALALAAGRVPLAARYPVTGERYALELVLAAQAAFAALLFPWLLRDLVAAVMAIASCWPVLALAVMLSALTPDTLLVAGGYMTLWLAVLTAWRTALASEKSQMIATAVAATWAIGGPVVWYLRAEFNSSMQASPISGPFYGPLTGALAQVDGLAGRWRAGDWLVLAVLLVLGLGAGWLAKVVRARRAVRR